MSCKCVLLRLLFASTTPRYLPFRSTDSAGLCVDGYTRVSYASRCSSRLSLSNETVPQRVHWMLS
ncbi:hypothetical protein M758_3G212100 [Ceratodon purpureus]|nr:hypothetical protein M758_3G212100 [Ceratodon purpureus]